MPKVTKGQRGRLEARLRTLSLSDQTLHRGDVRTLGRWVIEKYQIVTERPRLTLSKQAERSLMPAQLSSVLDSPFQYGVLGTR